MARKALCVGINNFQNYPGSALQGCVNDANDMVALLKKWLGFQSADIVKLTDAQATKVNIMNNLKEKVDGAKKGKYSYLIFSLSSHGTQVPDKNGDEADKADEAFCPYDLKSAGNVWDPKHIILDDELHDLFIQLPSNVLLEVYLDTCHSGTGLRAFDLVPDRNPRYIAPPSYEAFEQVEKLSSRGLANKLTEKSLVHHILWSGCKSDQTSADAHIAGSWHGAFTYYFCKVMNDSKNKLSRNDVMKKVRTYLSTNHFTQIPQLECEATKREAPVA